LGKILCKPRRAIWAQPGEFNSGNGWAVCWTTTAGPPRDVWREPRHECVHGYIPTLFNKSIDGLRRIGARGGRAWPKLPRPAAGGTDRGGARLTKSKVPEQESRARCHGSRRRKAALRLHPADL